MPTDRRACGAPADKNVPLVSRAYNCVRFAPRLERQKPRFPEIEPVPVVARRGYNLGGGADYNLVGNRGARNICVESEIVPGA